MSAKIIIPEIITSMDGAVDLLYHYHANERNLPQRGNLLVENFYIYKVFAPAGQPAKIACHVIPRPILYPNWFLP